MNDLINIYVNMVFFFSMDRQVSRMLPLMEATALRFPTDLCSFMSLSFSPPLNTHLCCHYSYYLLYFAGTVNRFAHLL